MWVLFASPSNSTNDLNIGLNCLATLVSVYPTNDYFDFESTKLRCKALSGQSKFIKIKIKNPKNHGCVIQYMCWFVFLVYVIDTIFSTTYRNGGSEIQARWQWWWNIFGMYLSQDHSYTLNSPIIHSTCTNIPIRNNSMNSWFGIELILTIVAKNTMKFLKPITWHLDVHNGCLTYL